ncbi:hypothetical protein Tco_1341202, partial [Tanacetum coccineum]
KIVEQKVKKSAGASNDDKNLAFVTTSCACSINIINTVNPEVSTATTKVNTVKMDDPNITMEEYIRLEEEKARRRSKWFLRSIDLNRWNSLKVGSLFASSIGCGGSDVGIA